jgi:hypothetical protein
VLDCRVDPLLSVDVVLGMRWKAFIREWLLGRGEVSVPDYFDPWLEFFGTGVSIFFFQFVCSLIWFQYLVSFVQVCSHCLSF